MTLGSVMLIAFIIFLINAFFINQKYKQFVNSRLIISERVNSLESDLNHELSILSVGELALSHSGKEILAIMKQEGIAFIKEETKSAELAVLLSTQSQFEYKNEPSYTSSKITQTSNDKKVKERINELEQEIETLKNALGAFAVGLDKVSQAQANQPDFIEGLVTANEIQAHYLKRLVENKELHDELLKKLLEIKGD